MLPLRQANGEPAPSQSGRGELELSNVMTAPVQDVAQLAFDAAAGAIDDLEASREQTRDVFSQQRLAGAHLRMAELQREGLGPSEEISAHLDAAERWYRAGGDAYAWRLPTIATLRAPTP